MALTEFFGQTATCSPRRQLILPITSPKAYRQHTALVGVKPKRNAWGQAILSKHTIYHTHFLGLPLSTRWHYKQPADDWVDLSWQRSGTPASALIKCFTASHLSLPKEEPGWFCLSQQLNVSLGTRLGLYGRLDDSCLQKHYCNSTTLRETG